MIDIRKYLEDNHIEPPNGMSKDRFIKDRFIKAISTHLPYAYEATNDEIKAIELTIKVIKHDTGVEYND